MTGAATQGPGVMVNAKLPVSPVRQQERMKAFCERRQVAAVWADVFHASQRVALGKQEKLSMCRATIWLKDAPVTKTILNHVLRVLSDHACPVMFIHLYISITSQRPWKQCFGKITCYIQPPHFRRLGFAGRTYHVD
jgi:hypothetical protein